MLQLVNLMTKLQDKNLSFGRKWMYRITPPVITLETVNSFTFLNNSGIRVRNILEEEPSRIESFFNSSQISFTNSLEDTRIADLEREVSRLREIINGIAGRSDCSG